MPFASSQIDVSHVAQLPLDLDEFGRGCRGQSEGENGIVEQKTETVTDSREGLTSDSEDHEGPRLAHGERRCFKDFKACLPD